MNNAGELKLGMKIDTGLQIGAARSGYACVCVCVCDMGLELVIGLV